MNPNLQEEYIEEEFHVSWYIIAYKFVFGVAEVVFALGLIFFGRAWLQRYNLYMVRELSEDPHDLLVYMTNTVIPNVLAHHAFLTIYLLLLGSAKIAGAIGLMYKKDWGVDLLVGMTIFMFPFQFIRFLLHPTLLDITYIAIGLFIAMYLINFKPHEWARRMAKKGKKHAAFLQRGETR